MDWSPVLTVVATGGVTLGGVWLNGKFAERTESRRLVEESRREAERLHHEEVAKAAAQSEAQQEEAHALADAIAGQFLDELSEIRRYREDEDGSFDLWFEERWKTRGDIGLRRSIGRITDPHDRSRLMQMLDALDDYEALARWAFSMSQPKVEELLALAFDLAATMARGQEPDSELAARFQEFQKDVRDNNAYREAQAELQREQWRAEAEARKEASSNQDDPNT